MPVDLLTTFVDRKRELGLFKAMLLRQTNKRILLILTEGEQGKSWFLRRLVYECEAQKPPIPTILLDFDQRRNGLSDYRDVADEVRRHLGDNCTPNICACEAAIFTPSPLVQIQTGSGEGTVDFGRRGQFDQTNISDVAGRDYISVTNVDGNVLPIDPRLAQEEMGRAVQKDLCQLSDTHPRTVLLLDTFEQANSETRTWLERWILEPMRHQLPNLVIVIAGQPQCKILFSHSTLWHSLITTVERLGSFDENDIMIYYQQRGLTISESEKPLLLDLACASPARMALIGDWISEARGVQDGK